MPAVDTDRLWQRHLAMARIGATADGGVNRPCLSEADRAARALLASWAAARGFAIAVDPVGNLFIRREGHDDTAPVLTGSHMDSQPRGGRFDGIYGVLAGFEALEAIADAGMTTRRPLEVVAWTNEEGARFPPGCMGSMCFTGARSLDDFLGIRDEDDVTFGAALAETLAALPKAIRRPFGPPPAAYIEAHIEQGPVLERAGVPIGIVSGIQGARWFEVEVHGDCAHAGTAPLTLRRDALRAAVAMVSALGIAFADPGDVTRFTVGRFTVAPNSPNTVADRAIFSVDLRHPDAATLERLGDKVDPICRRERERCDVAIRETLSAAPCVFDPGVTARIAAAAAELKLPSLSLTSGAFHDALFLAREVPSGMIFVPCAGGVSHHPSESATPADLAAGCRVLAATILALAE